MGGNVEIIILLLGSATNLWGQRLRTTKLKNQDREIGIDKWTISDDGTGPAREENGTTRTSG